jgi:radical SAM superfamily enzyme YgiQ (UPF0313 family)
MPRELCIVEPRQSGAAAAPSPEGKERVLRGTNGTVTVGLVQLNTVFDGTLYLPYSVALLQAYLQGHAARPERYRFPLPLVERLPPGEAEARLAPADIAGFSLYVWNANRSLAIARALAEQKPETLVVFGGPHVPDGAEEFLRTNPFIDVVCHGEGERTFFEIAERFPDRTWDDVDGVSYLDGAGRFVTTPGRARMKELEEVPSPFLTGVFDPLMASRPDGLWRAVWETNRGCPFKCTFCDWGSGAVNTKVHRFELDRVLAEAEWIGDRKISYVFVADANFGILPRDVEIAEALVAARERHGYPRTVLVQQTKNQTERAYLTLKLLTDAHMSTEINVSLQSTTPEVLTAIKRQNISLETYAEVQRRFVREGMPTYVDMIVGLPAETLQSFKESVSRVVDGGQHHRIQFHNLSVLPNAEMGDPDYQAQWGVEMVTSGVVNNHAPPDPYDDGIVETQEIVIATSTMDRSDWREARSFAWLTLLYHLDHLLMWPILVTWKLSGVDFWRLLDALILADPERFPVLGELRRSCLDFATGIQDGGPEYVLSEDWLGSYWTVDEYLFIKVCMEDRLDDLFAEAEQVLAPFLPETHPDVEPRVVLEDAVRFNHARLRHPLADGRVVVDCAYDVLAFGEAVFVGEEGQWRTGPVRYEIEHTRYADLDAWFRELVRDRREGKLADVRVVRRDASAVVAGPRA